MKDFKTQFYTLVGIGLFCISGVASAGAVGFAALGQCSGGGVMVDATHINWSPTGTVAGTGCFNTGIPTSITYSGGVVGPGATGNIQNLVAGGGSVDQFMTILGSSPLLDFVLDGFAPTPTNNTACDTTVGDSCIIFPGSPFFLTNTVTGVSVNLDAFGHITDAGTTTLWTAIFSTQISNTTDSAIQSTILGHGSISSTYSAALTLSPEPGTVSMFLLGGAALIGLGRKRFSKS
jgi:hypothetical protein